MTYFYSNLLILSRFFFIAGEEGGSLNSKI